ncbi:hypothetical protein WG909_05655 [Peptostreptococcaceae bacterium AGR-M142]
MEKYTLNSKWKLYMFLFLIIILGLTLQFFNLKNQGSNSKFLSLNSYLPIAKDKIVLLQLDYIDNNEEIIKAKKKQLIPNPKEKIRLLNNSTDVTDYFDINKCEILGDSKRSFKKIINKKDNIRTIVLFMNFSKELKDKKTINIDSLKINDKIYKIGKIKLDILKENPKLISLSSSSGLHFALNSYNFKISFNDDDIKLNDLYFDDFEKYIESITAKLNDKEINNYKNKIFSKDDVLEFYIKFNKSKEYFTYEFAPLTIYQKDNKEFKFAPIKAIYLGQKK